MRGTLKYEDVGKEVSGLIPTYAGNTPSLKAIALGGGLIPTYAGNTVVVAHVRGGGGAHPHVCGEHRTRGGKFLIG